MVRFSCSVCSASAPIIGDQHTPITFVNKTLFLQFYPLPFFVFQTFHVVAELLFFL